MIILVLVILIILAILIVISSTAFTLILQHQLRVSIVFLGIKIRRISQQGLLIGLDSSLPVLLLNRNVTLIVVVIRGTFRNRSHILQLFQRFTGLVKIAFAVKSSGQIVVCSKRQRVLRLRLTVFNLSILPIFFSELTVSRTNFFPVCLAGHRDAGKHQQKSGE